MHCDDIQKLGAKAARDGLTILDCPFLKADQMPGHTGELISRWKAKVDAWEAGWVAETVSREPLASSRPPPRQIDRRL